jgi:hypothetical protein
VARHSTLLVAMIAVALPAACTDADPRVEQRARFGAAWAEFVEPHEIEAALPLLSAHELAVNVAWPAANLGRPDLIALAKRAEAEAVELRPWLLLDESDGYWPGSSNAQKFASAARELIEVWEQNQLSPTALIVDMEMRKDRADAVAELLGGDSPDLLGAVDLLRAGIDPVQYAEATLEYRRLSEALRARGWRVHLTTLPQVLDDYADGDDGVRQALGIPLDGIVWDRVTFQAYRTLFGDLLGGTGDAPRPSSYFVYSYALDARLQFGALAGLDVGMVGHGVSPSSTYLNGAELGADVAAALAAGIPRAAINVYNLDGMLSRPPTDAWLVAAERIEPPAEDAASVSIRNIAKLLDQAL